jgi:cytochrome P450
VDQTSPTSTSLLGGIMGALAELEASDTSDVSGAGSRDSAEQAVLSLLLGGFETTSWMLANALSALLAHPDAMARVRDDLSLAPKAVTESIRWCPSVPGTLRMAERDVVLDDDLCLAADTVFYVAGITSHYDSARHPDPYVFDIDRNPPGTPMVFGGGVHHCVGMSLARMVVRVAVESLLALTPGLRAAPDFTYGVHGGPAHGPDRLPVVLF